MAIRRDTRYPGRWTPADADFPLGGPKNRTTSTSKDGSYFERDFMADYEAFFQRLMTEAGITASELSDTALTSQFYNALVNNMTLSNPSQEWSPDVNYNVGQEVIRDGLRYVARAASGPDNGGAQQPDPSIVEYWFETPSVGTSAFELLSVPVGIELAFDTPPPTDDPRFRYVKLTYNDAYNTSLLTSQTISGSAPELVSTAVISAVQSPINGQTIDMINTMGTFIRPGVAAGVRQLSDNRSHNHTASGTAQETAFLAPGPGRDFRNATVTTSASGGDEARPYNISRVFYKRIY